MIMLHRHVRIAVLVGAGTLMAACKDPNPIGPFPAEASRSLRIEGPSNVAPGQTASFRAVLTQQGRPTQDVTAQAQWEIGDSSLATLAGAGLVTGRERGETGVTATYSGLRSVQQVFVLENGTFRLNGRVREGPVAVANARVAVSRGTGTGLVTTAKTDGTFVLYGVAGSVDLAVTHAEYHPLTLTQLVTSHATADIEVTPLRAPYQMTGAWTLTFNASSSCPAGPVQFPRSYAAAVTQTGGEIKLAMGTDACNGPCPVVFTGRVSNRSVSIDFPGDVIDGAWLQELLPSGLLLMIQGVAQGTESNDAIEGSFSGEITYVVRSPAFSVTRCERTDHVFRMTRR
jgi:hypothetical protein